MKNAKNYLFTALGAALAIGGAVLLKTLSQPEGIWITLPYLCIGIGCGLFGYGLGEILSRAARKRHPELEKQQAIEAKDERNIALSNASKAKAYDMMSYVFGALLLVYALGGESPKIVIPFVVAYLFVQGIFVYYLVRLNKTY